jgi:transcription factor C subunit 7
LRRLAPSRAVIKNIPVGLSEWYYPVKPGTGLQPRPSSASTLKAYIPEIDDSWSSVWYPSRKGEDMVALHDRLAGFLSVLIPEVQRRFAGVHKRILLVSHAATVAALARELVGDRNLSFQVACCSLTVLDRKDAVAEESAQRKAIGNWRTRLLGDGRHLKDGLQRAWGFMDGAIANGEVSVVATAISVRCDVGLDTHTRPTSLQIVYEPGEPGTENEQDEPVGSQIIELSSSRM